MGDNKTGNNEFSFDAIVIGSGISGGWAAKEFCDRGLKTLVLERGRDVKHIKDYPTTNLDPWEFKYRTRLPAVVKNENPIAASCYAFDDATQHFFVKDKEHPYVQDKPFDWIRGYQVGGKSLIWARQTQRWSKFDLRARRGIILQWTGPSVTKTLHHGTVMLKNLPGLAVTKMAWKHFPTESFCQHGK